jgi:orotate phosphoribosyltransferase
MQHATLAARIRQVSKIRGTFTLRSGKISDTYFDKFLFQSDPELLRDIVRQMAPLVPPGTEVLCGLELGGIPVVTALSQVTGLPAAFIRKSRKAYGTEKYAEGPPLAGKHIALVEDVVSTGGALLDAASMLRADGVRVPLAICVIDRQTGGRERLAEAGIELRSLFTSQDVDGAA